jgi:hypothetical protein
MLEVENEDAQQQQQQFGEEIVDEEIKIANFGANVASAGLGNNGRNGTKSSGAVKLSSSPKLENLMSSTTGDAMETAASAVNVMSKGRAGADKEMEENAGPIKLKMTTSPPLHPVRKGPEKPVPSKEPQRQTSLPAQPVQKSAPAGISRLQPAALLRVAISNNSSNTRKSAPASQWRESEAKVATSLPKPQPPNFKKSDNPKQMNTDTPVENQNNNAKIPAKIETNTEPVKRITPAVKPTKSDSNTKSNSNIMNGSHPQ